jgi:hypothetical protein
MGMMDKVLQAGLAAGMSATDGIHKSRVQSGGPILRRPQIAPPNVLRPRKEHVDHAPRRRGRHPSTSHEYRRLELGRQANMALVPGPAPRRCRRLVDPPQELHQLVRYCVGIRQRRERANLRPAIQGTAPWRVHHPDVMVHRAQRGESTLAIPRPGEDAEGVPRPSRSRLCRHISRAWAHPCIALCAGGQRPRGMHLKEPHER